MTTASKTVHPTDEELMDIPIDIELPIEEADPDPVPEVPTAPEEEAPEDQEEAKESNGKEPTKAGAQRHVDIRRFRLKRNEDESGISGVGYVAEGVQFSTGACVIKWLTATSCVGIYNSYVEMIHIHGHGGKTVIEWIDEGFES